MIAKIKDLIINGLKNSSLQSSLQKWLLSTCLISALGLRSSLQAQTLAQTLCKENRLDWQLFIKNPFEQPFAETSNLRKV